MIRGLETSRSAMKYLQKKQEVVGNNIANTGTTGFKEQIAIANTKEEMNIINRRTGEQVGTINPGINIEDIYEISSQGIFEDTGIDTDFAILGEGYFTLEKNDGSYVYTRNGNFNFDANGKLVNENGYSVIAKNTNTGANSYIYSGDDDISVTPEGIMKNTDTDGLKFNVVKFDDVQLLARAGESLYTAEDVQPIEDNDSYIKQFSLENSNVDMTGQMIKMIEVSREYSANQRVLKSTDDTLQKAVNELGSLK
ncbi:flagellar hook-basal body complex protein [Clostridium sp. DL1XJH146]